METYPVLFDLHTHSVASGHGTCDTITHMAKAASRSSLQLLGISDHGPASPGAGASSYFRGLRLAERQRCGISLLYGVELNILNKTGKVDLPDELLSSLDYALISMHSPVFCSGTIASNTESYLRAMEHPKVRFLGHPDDGRFPVDYRALLTEAKRRHVYPELNNASLMPNAYRTEGYQNSCRILELCRELSLPVLLSSDSHGAAHVGDMSYLLPLLAAFDFPPELVLNTNLRSLEAILS